MAWWHHITVWILFNIGPDNGLSPIWRWAIIETNADSLWVRPLGTNVNGILLEIQTNTLRKMCLSHFLQFVFHSRDFDASRMVSSMVLPDAPIKTCGALQKLLWTVNSLRPSEAYMCQETMPSLVQWLVARSAISHYLIQCWNIVNWTPRNKLQGNFHWNIYVFIQENMFENMCKMASILSRPQCA